MRRWKCEICETLNDLKRPTCFICHTKRRISDKNRWKCRYCQSWNPPDVAHCLSCDADRNLWGDTFSATLHPPAPTQECAFADCKKPALEGGLYCEYHEKTLCPVCHIALKAEGMDYCADCGEALVKKQTKGLRRINRALRVGNIVLAILFALLLLSYLFYFN